MSTKPDSVELGVAKDLCRLHAEHLTRLIGPEMNTLRASVERSGGVGHRVAASPVWPVESLATTLVRGSILAISMA